MGGIFYFISMDQWAMTAYESLYTTFSGVFVRLNFRITRENCSSDIPEEIVCKNMRINLVFKMNPVPKERARTVRTRSGFVRTYTPDKTAVAQQFIAIEARKQFKSPPLNGPLSITVNFYMPIPDSFSKNKRERMNRQLHTSRPDIDNLFKLVTDSLNEIVYHDDKQIAIATCTKTYDLNPRIEVMIDYGFGNGDI